MARSYADFKAQVKKGLSNIRKTYNLSDADIDKYLKESEGEIQGAYRRYQHGYARGTMTDEQHFASEASAIAFSLELSY